jgi:4-aminobutyrate aminotransferase-like enzyme
VVNAITASALRLTPPLNISEADMDAAVDILGRVLQSL